MARDLRYMDTWPSSFKVQLFCDLGHSHDRQHPQPFDSRTSKPFALCVRSALALGGGAWSILHVGKLPFKGCRLVIPGPRFICMDHTISRPITIHHRRMSNDLRKTLFSGNPVPVSISGRSGMWDTYGRISGRTQEGVVSGFFRAHDDFGAIDNRPIVIA